MGTKNAHIDAYIGKSPEFAKPILTHLREVVHSACPDVEEALKWSVPFFVYKGNLCQMAAFKEHCAFGFWKGSLVVGDVGESAADAAGHFGRITSVSDLPSKRVLSGFVKKAMALNDAGTKAPTPPKKAKPALVVPDFLAAALKRNRKASATFEKFSPSQRREYVDWLVDAKSEDTRQRRLEQALEWIAEGKSRNWKYQKS